MLFSSNFVIKTREKKNRIEGIVDCLWPLTVLPSTRTPKRRWRLRSCIGLSSPSSTPSGPTGSSACSATFSMRTWGWTQYEEISDQTEACFWGRTADRMEHLTEQFCNLSLDLCFVYSHVFMQTWSITISKPACRRISLLLKVYSSDAVIFFLILWPPSEISHSLIKTMEKLSRLFFFCQTLLFLCRWSTSSTSSRLTPLWKNSRLCKLELSSWLLQLV